MTYNLGHAWMTSQC